MSLLSEPPSLAASRPFFENFNGIRALAALLVLLFHVGAVLKGKAGIGFEFYSQWFGYAAGYGVDLFFALSGFLITYLLLYERQYSGRIDVIGFYIRRIGRIWPLYFVVGVGGCFFGPIILSALGGDGQFPLDGINVWRNLFHLFTFTVNLQVASGDTNRGVVGSLWSVCIEEQFYAVWAPLFAFAGKKLSRVLVALGSVGACVFLYLDDGAAYYSTCARLLNFSLAAYRALLVFVSSSKDKHDYYPWERLFGRRTQGCILGLTMIYVLAGHQFAIPAKARYFVNAISATYIVMAAAQASSLWSLDNKAMNLLGRISYGVYMYHLLCVQIVVAAIAPMLIAYPWSQHVVPICSLMLVTGVSLVSFRFIENPAVRWARSRRAKGKG